MHRMTQGRCASPRSRVRGAALLLLLAAGAAEPCAAQRLSSVWLPEADSARGVSQAALVPTSPAYQPHVVRWWEAGIVVAGAGALLSDDSHVAEEVGEHPTSGAAHAADVFRAGGDGRVYIALSLATLGAGLLTKSPGITRTGGQLAVSGALAAASFGVLKLATGRSRPDAGEGAYQFHPFAGNGSFPSGHSAMAFALATTLGDASHSTWVTAGLYMFAAGTAWSRVYNERHWPSDVFLGAALGVTSAKLVNGRWRIFGLRPPSFLLSPETAGMRISF
jgi:membrane-associated phospholipid phosphatase